MLTIDWTFYLGFALTICLLSYIIGDQILFRLSVYAVSGLTAAVAIISLTEYWLLPLFEQPEGAVIFLIAAAAVLALLTTGMRYLSALSVIVLSFLIAVGAAVTLTGALRGTLLALVISSSTGTGSNVLAGVVMFIGVVSSFAYFQHRGRLDRKQQPQRSRVNQVVARVGELFIGIALGGIYGAVMITALTILIQRIALYLTLLA